MSAEQRDQPQTIEELVGHLDQRRVNRRLNELGDEGIALVLELAAIKADNSEAELAARDLRRHIMDGGTPGSFLEEFPAHQGVDFRGLILDEPSIELAEAFSLSPGVRRPALEVKKREMTAEVIEEPELALSSEGHIKTEVLFERYPSVKALFSDDSFWVEEDGQDKMMPRRTIEVLLAKKDGTDMSNEYQQVVMGGLWKEWKQENPEQTGRPIKGRGVSIFLNQEEAVNFLWFVHTQTSDEKSSFRNFSITSTVTPAPGEDKKK